jgi:hypothetical protein
VIAGKGHESYQILGSETIHFDDREVAVEELARLGFADDAATAAGGDSASAAGDAPAPGPDGASATAPDGAQGAP